MKTTNNGLAIIKKYETCKLKAYKCPAGRWTIGWGHTRDVKEGDFCTQRQADEWLKEDVIEFERIVCAWFKKVNQNQFDALVSLMYNCGPGNIKKGPIYAAVKADPNDTRIRGYFMMHVYANGRHDGKDNDGDGLIDEPGEVKKLDGLVRRRTEEVTLYFKK
jgi:lysozyme